MSYKTSVCAFFILFSFYSFVQAQGLVLSGKVIDTSGTSVNKAVVRLVKAGLSDTTQSDGLFSFKIDGKTAAALYSSQKQSPVNPFLKNGLINFSIGTESKHVSATLYDIKGRSVRMLFKGVIGNGSYTLNPLSLYNGRLSSGFYFIKLNIGNEKFTFKYTATENLRHSTMPGASVLLEPQAVSSLAKSVSSVILDTLIAEKINYLTGKQTEYVMLPVYMLNGALADIVFYSDQDHDGLTDYEETYVYGTNLKEADTDGDGWNDYFEVTRFSSDAPDNFNPFLADVPSLDVAIAGVPQVTFNYAQSTQTSNAIAITEASSISAGNSSSYTHTDSWSNQIGWSSKITSGFEAGGDAVFKLSVDVESGLSASFNNEYGCAISNEKQTSNSSSYENAKTTATTNGLSFSSGKLSVPVKISNPSNVSCKLTSLILSAFYFSTNDASYKKVVVSNLNCAAATGIQINGKDQTSIYTFENPAIALSKMEGLVKNASKLFVTIAGYSLESTLFNGITSNLTGNITEVGRKTAKLVVDFGPALNKPCIKYNVAVKTKYNKFLEEYEPVTLFDVLNYSGIHFNDSVTSKSASLVSIQNVKNGSIPGAFWFITIRRGGETFGYPAYLSDFKLNNVPVYKEDVISCILSYDRDEDGLTSIEEHMYGTSDDKIDSDGDALSDLVEVNGFSKSGNTYKTNPTKLDTDGDGVSDLLDDNPCGPMPVDSVAYVQMFDLVDGMLPDAGALPAAKRIYVSGDTTSFSCDMQWTTGSEMKLVVQTWKPVSSIKVINNNKPLDTVTVTKLLSYPPCRYLVNTTVFPGKNSYTIIARSADNRFTTTYQLNNLTGLLPMITDWKLNTPATQKFRKLNAEIRHLERPDSMVTGAIIAEACTTWTRAVDQSGLTIPLSDDSVAQVHVVGDTITVVREGGLISRAKIIKILAGNVDNSILSATIDSLIPNKQYTFLACTYHQRDLGMIKSYSYGIANAKVMIIPGKIQVQSSFKILCDRDADNDLLSLMNIELEYSLERWNMEYGSEYVEARSYYLKKSQNYDPAILIKSSGSYSIPTDTLIWSQRAQRWILSLYDMDIQSVYPLQFSEDLGSLAFNVYLYKYSHPDSANFEIIDNPEAPVYSGVKTLTKTQSKIFEIHHTQADIRVEATFSWSYID